jgi:hypothetical protein
MDKEDAIVRFFMTSKFSDSFHDDGINDNAKIWQGRKDSNLRMAGSKPAALPLGDAPVVIAQL